MRTEDAPRRLRTPPEFRHHRGVGILGQRAHEAVGRRIARQLMVVEQEPTQDFATLGVVGRAESIKGPGKIVEDRARLREPRAAMLDDRYLPHYVDRTIRG